MIVNPGTNVESSRKALKLSERFEIVYGGAGVHPNDGHDWNAESVDDLRELARQNKIVAIGEIGLDFYREHTEKNKQRMMLEEQLDLAEEMELPVIIHNRNADEEIIERLGGWQKSLAAKKSKLAQNPGVMHSISGNIDFVQFALEHNFYVGLTGPVTFKNAKELQDIVHQIPMEKILIETDSPFLSPHPERGKRNEPAKVKLVADKIAELQGIEKSEVYKISTNNALRLFNVELPL